jgi:hypothetical protein
MAASTGRLAAIRDRIVALRRVPAHMLLSHPRNWRRHPQHQRGALRGLNLAGEQRPGVPDFLEQARPTRS